jgi:uncharacterized MAPEG superfamily protein
MTIAIAYWCVLIAAALPYIWVGIAKAGARGYDNRDPRGWMARQSEPRRQRAYAAQLNAFEAFPAFAAGVALASIAGVDARRVALLAGVFVAARILHGLFYLADRATLRSLAWLVGIVCSFALLGSAAMAIA